MRSAEHSGEASIGVHDDAIISQRNGPLLHLFNHHPIRLIRPGKRVHLRTTGAVNHDRINVPVTNRLQGLIRLGKLSSQFFVLGYELLRSFRFGRHDPVPLGYDMGLKSSPNRTRSLLLKSPISRRNGRGSCLISVGAAMMFSSFANSGCLARSITSSS